MAKPVLWIIYRPQQKMVLGYTAHYGPGSYKSPSWEIAVDSIVGWNTWIRAIVFGWGYDPQVPLRPWPQVWYDRTTKRGNITSGFALCGFFLTVGGIPDKKAVP